MSAYVIVEFKVKDPEMYRERYGPIAGQTAKEHGGEALANSNWEVLHGDGSLEAQPAERTAGQPSGDTHPPGDMAGSVGSQKLGCGRRELESVAVIIDGQRLDQSLLYSRPGVDLSPQPQVEVFGQPSIVAKADLHGHPALDHPSAGIGGLEAGDDPLEHHAPAQSVHGDTRLL